MTKSDETARENTGSNVSVSEADQRVSERMVVNREFQSIEEFVAEYVTDLSRSGVFIRSDDPLAIGTRVDLRFSVIIEDFETIEGVGEVVRVVAPGGDEPPGMGVAFVELSAYSQALINKLFIR